MCSPNKGPAINGKGFEQVPGCVAKMHAEPSCVQASPTAHDPHEPPQPSEPQTLLLHFGVQFLAAQTAQFAAAACEQRSPVSVHVSVVQESPSSHGSGPGTHVPFA
jgi:hypothetical protein